MNGTIKVQGVSMSVAAAECVEECAVDVAKDVESLRSGQTTRDALLADCLDGADDDRKQGWHDYVDAVVAASAKSETRIQRAAKHIGAEQIKDGRWAHYDDATACYYLVTAEQLATVCDYLDSDNEQIAKDAYSHWCAGTTSTKMPEGWSPSEPFTVWVYPSEDDIAGGRKPTDMILIGCASDVADGRRILRGRAGQIQDVIDGDVTNVEARE